MSIAKTKELEIKNKEAQDLMSVTKTPHSVLQDEEQLETKYNVDLPMEKLNVDDKDVNQTESTVVTENRYYTGQIFYTPKDTNVWIAEFRISKLASIQMKHYEDKNIRDKDQIVVFEFIYPVNGYIELDLNIKQERLFKGWTITPHMLPLRLYKRDADLFESGELSDPPYCLITVFGKTAHDTELFLNYRIGLIGITSDINMLSINRTLDTHLLRVATSHHTIQPVDVTSSDIDEEDDESSHSNDDIEINDEQEEETTCLIGKHEDEEEDDESLHSKDKETKDEQEKETIGLGKHEDGAYSQHDKQNMYSLQICSCCTILDLRKGKGCAKTYKEYYPQLLVLNSFHEVSTHFKHTLEVKIKLSAQTEKLSNKYQECSERTWLALKNMSLKHLLDFDDIKIVLNATFRMGVSAKHISDLLYYHAHNISPGWWKINYIHHLAKTFLGDLCPEVISEWNNYFDIFRAYCSDRNRKEYAHMLFNTSSDIFFFLEIDESYDHFTLQMISELRKTISYILDLPELSLHLICLET